MAKKTPSSETKQTTTKTPASTDKGAKGLAPAAAEPIAEQSKAKAEPAQTPAPTGLGGNAPAPSTAAAASKTKAGGVATVQSADKTPAQAAAKAPPTPAPPPLEQASPVTAAQAKASQGESTQSPTVVEPIAAVTPTPQLPSEAEFVASLKPLPTEAGDEEAAKLDLLREVEAQFELFKGASEAIAETGGTEESHPGPVLAPQTPAEPTPQPPAEPEYYQAPEPEHRYEGPTMPHMYIVQITPELAPVAKVGGLADVVFGLSNELEIRGNSVEIILPKYDCLRYDHIWGLCETFNDLWVPWFGGAIHCTVFFGFVHGRKCFFIEPHSADNFFNRGSVYGFTDDVLRFAFFTRAAMEFMWKSGKNPDIIHCHDWQTALAPGVPFRDLPASWGCGIRVSASPSTTSSTKA